MDHLKENDRFTSHLVCKAAASVLAYPCMNPAHGRFVPAGAPVGSQAPALVYELTPGVGLRQASEQ